MRTFLTTATLILCFGVLAASSGAALAGAEVSGAGAATTTVPFTLAQYYNPPSYNDQQGYDNPPPEYHRHCHRECYRWDYYRNCVGYRRVCD
jgi:hypothetical protein